MVNTTLNKAQPAAVLHIPVHFGSYARQEAAKPFQKLMGERICTADHRCQEKQGLDLHTPANQTTSAAETQMQQQ